MLLAGIAYFIRDWRNLQLAISAPGFLLIFYIWWGGKFINFRIWQFSLLLRPTFHLFFPSTSALCFPARVLPQSARWLLANDRKEEAIALLRKAALVNGRVLPPTLHVCLSILNFFLYFFPSQYFMHYGPGLTLSGWFSVQNWELVFCLCVHDKGMLPKHLYTELDRDTTNQRALWQIVCFQIQTVSMYMYWLTWLCSESLPKALHCTKSRSVIGYACFSRANVLIMASKTEPMCELCRLNYKSCVFPGWENLWSRKPKSLSSRSRTDASNEKEGFHFVLHLVKSVKKHNLNRPTSNPTPIQQSFHLFSLSSL